MAHVPNMFSQRDKPRDHDVLDVYGHILILILSLGQEPNGGRAYLDRPAPTRIRRIPVRQKGPGVSTLRYMVPGLRMEFNPQQHRHAWLSNCRQYVNRAR